jgi:hypothetical protein
MKMKNLAGNFWKLGVKPEWGNKIFGNLCSKYGDL